MKSLLIALSLIGLSLPAFACEGEAAANTTATPTAQRTVAAADTTAPTASYTVKGMHCAGCKASIEAKVCNMPGIATCKVEITNLKKQLGRVTLTAADGSTLDDATVTKAIKDAGYEASVTAKK